MNIKKLIRILKYKLNKNDLIFDDGPFTELEYKLIMDKDVCVTLAYYDTNLKRHIVLLKQLTLEVQ